MILKPETKSTISKKQILESQGETFCLIKQSVATPKGENFLNKWGGYISIERTGMIRRTDGRLYYTNSTIYDNKIPIVIEAIDYTLEMRSDGDRISGFDDKNDGPVIGQGSKLRFDQDNWVTFFGNKYRKGGVEVTTAGFRFLSGTERFENDSVLTFDGQSWQPAK